jgi:hypothetical protein
VKGELQIPAREAGARTYRPDDITMINVQNALFEDIKSRVFIVLCHDFPSSTLERRAALYLWQICLLSANSSCDSIFKNRCEKINRIETKTVIEEMRTIQQSCLLRVSIQRKQSRIQTGEFAVFATE